MKANKRILCLTLVTLLSASAVAAQEKAGTAERLGKVHFSTSCTSTVEADFDRAVARLHSFWYSAAVKAFSALTETEPACAMGYWGMAMSHWYPLWEPPTAAALQRGWAAVEKAKAIGGKTDRERDYVAAIEAFYLKKELKG